MGASRTISRAYKCALALSICVQLEMFMYFASIGCFLDEISKGLLGAKPQHRILFLVGYSITSASVVPWLYVVSNPILLRSLTLTHPPAYAGLVRRSPREQEDDVRVLRPEHLVFGSQRCHVLCRQCPLAGHTGRADSLTPRSRIPSG